MTNDKMFYPMQFDLRQIVKLTVYALLLFNFVFYIFDDWSRAQHTLRGGGGFLDWTAAFTTSIDETAWFVLLFLFELETYALTDAALTRKRVKLMHMIRMVCYIFLAHTIYANATSAIEHLVETPANIANLCELAGKDLSFTSNYAYTLITAENCSSLVSGGQYFWLDGGASVTDAYGYGLSRYMAWLDLFESISWLGILFCIEAVVRLQDRGISGGRRIQFFNVIKRCLYCVLWVAIGHWIYLGHYVYAWDEFVWIAGFAIIDMNVADWRKELIDEGESPHSPSVS